MGALLQIAGQLISRVLIAVFAWSFSFIGSDVNFTLSQSTSSPQAITTPIFVEIDENKIDIVKNKITATSSVVSKTAPAKLTPSAPKIVTPKLEQVVAPKPSPIIPPKETPSLKNIPVPNIELPQIASEITRGIALGEWSEIYTNSKDTVVNIFCVSTNGNMVSISTGSGVIISSNGIVLTNSHVAENFLIPGRDCSIRQGEIAVDKYKASLVYINENWLRKNAKVLFTQGARGNGENDFALISLNSKVDGSNIPSYIKFTNINQTELDEDNRNDKILIAGYPASTLGTISLRKYLTFLADVINITNVYTLDGTHVDVFETSVTKVGQHGSSGGGIFDEKNNLLGLIVSVNDESGESRVNAITTTYISRALKNETGKSLKDFANTDKASLLSSFQSKQNAMFEYVKPFIK